MSAGLKSIAVAPGATTNATARTGSVPTNRGPRETRWCRWLVPRRNARRTGIANPAWRCRWGDQHAALRTACAQQPGATGPDDWREAGYGNGPLEVVVRRRRRPTVGQRPGRQLNGYRRTAEFLAKRARGRNAEIAPERGQCRAASGLVAQNSVPRQARSTARDPDLDYWHSRRAVVWFHLAQRPVLRLTYQLSRGC